METTLGKEVGQMLTSEHQKNGVKLHMGQNVKEITSDYDGKANGVVLEDGTKINVDLVIVGTGISPATKYLERHESGIKVDDKGAIVCDPFLETSVKDIFAAGDVASFPYWYNGNQIRIEHWINALD